MPLALENDTCPLSHLSPLCTPSPTAAQEAGEGAGAGNPPGCEPWGASTLLSPASLCCHGADFCYLLTIKVLRDVLRSSALGGGGEAVCATQQP